MIAVRGELDMLTASAFRSALHEAAEASGPVLVDLCDVTFMDSTGLTTLLRGHAHLLEHGRGVAVARAEGSPVARLFALAAVATIFDLHAGRAAARLALPARRR